MDTHPRQPLGWALDRAGPHGCQTKGDGTLRRRQVCCGIQPMSWPRETTGADYGRVGRSQVAAPEPEQAPEPAPEPPTEVSPAPAEPEDVDLFSPPEAAPPADEPMDDLFGAPAEEPAAEEEEAEEQHEGYLNEPICVCQLCSPSST